VNIRVPFLDLKKQYNHLKVDIDLAIKEVLNTTSFIKGPAVGRFERAFANYLNVQHCVGVGNGTDALILCLKAIGVKPGQEVITVPNTFIATIEAIAAVGAIPVLADIDYRTYTIDPLSVERAVTAKTVAIIPVHLYGMPCDMDPIVDIAKHNGLRIICDGAQAHGAKYKGKSLAYYCDAITYSFYPGKNLGAYGDAGAVVTNNDEIANRVRNLADHGREEKYLHKEYGLNSRLDTIQAAILCAKLPHLDTWNQRRVQIADKYNEGLKDLARLVCPYVPDYAAPVWHLYVIKVEERDGLQEYLKNCGIQTGIHYPVAIPEQPAAQNVVVKCNQSMISKMSSELLSLPICPEMTDDMVYYVVESVKRFYQ